MASAEVAVAGPIRGKARRRRRPWPLVAGLGLLSVSAILHLLFTVYLMSPFFEALPDELIEAARIDGAGLHRTFLRILLPLAKPALATLVIFNILWAWNEFLFALLMLQSDGVKTLTVGVLSLQGRFTTDYPALMAGLLITSLPVIGAYLVFQRHLVRGIVAGAVQ